jgi:hypothetical protein
VQYVGCERVANGMGPTVTAGQRRCKNRDDYSIVVITAMDVTARSGTDSRASGSPLSKRSRAIYCNGLKR